MSVLFFIENVKWMKHFASEALRKRRFTTQNVQIKSQNVAYLLKWLFWMSFKSCFLLKTCAYHRLECLMFARCLRTVMGEEQSCVQRKVESAGVAWTGAGNVEAMLTRSLYLLKCSYSNESWKIENKRYLSLIHSGLASAMRRVCSWALLLSRVWVKYWNTKLFVGRTKFVQDGKLETWDDNAREEIVIKAITRSPVDL